MRKLTPGWLFGFAVAALVVLPLTSFIDSYTLFIVNTLLVFAVLAASLDLLVGYTGYMSLAHATFFGIGGYASAQLVMVFNIPYLAGFVAAVVIVAVVAGLVGYVSMRATGIYFAIITFAVAIIAETLFGKLEVLTRGSSGIPGVPGISLPGFALTTTTDYYYLFLAAFVVVFVGKWLLVTSRTGRALKGIREDENLAESVGIDTTRYKVYAFLLAAVVSGAMGSFWAHYNHFIGPATGGFFQSFMLFVMVVAGGRGTLLGPILGAALLVYVRDYLDLLSPSVTSILFGVLLLVIIVVAPQGFYPWLREKGTQASRRVEQLLGRHAERGDSQ